MTNDEVLLKQMEAALNIMSQYDKKEEVKEVKTETKVEDKKE
jgi:hypothetical protein